MSNAIFAPNFNPLIPGNEQVYVVNFWSYNQDLQSSEYGGFFPQGMVRIIDNQQSILLNPNSVIQKITKNEYDELIVAKRIEIAQIFLEYAVLDEFTLWFTLNDVEVNSENMSLEKLSKENSPLFRDGSQFNNFLPVAIPVNSNGRLLQVEDLFGTYCKYNNEGVWIDCDKCLPFEAEYMNTISFYLNTEQGPELVVNDKYIIFFNHPKIAPPGSKLLTKISAPDCKLCHKYVVYCDPLSVIPPSGRFDIPEFGLGVQIEQIMENPIVYSDYPDNAKFFHTKEKAQDYYNSVLAEDPKWVCQVPPMSMGEDLSEECFAISDMCVEFLSETNPSKIYNSQQECEENCNKKWYCLEYQCTKVDKNSQLVEGLQGYDTQEECENNCEIPTITPS